MKRDLPNRVIVAMGRMMNDGNGPDDPYTAALLSLRSAVEFGLARIDVRLGQVERRMERLEDKVDEFRAETRGDFIDLKKRVSALETHR